MKRRTSSTSAVSTRTARCRLPLLDPASEEEVAREIPAARRCGGGEIPAGLRQAAAGREEGGGRERRWLGLSGVRPSPLSSLYRRGGQPLPLPQVLGAAKGETCPPRRPLPFRVRVSLGLAAWAFREGLWPAHVGCCASSQPYGQVGPTMEPSGTF